MLGSWAALALRTAAQAANVSQSLFSDDIIRHYIVADSAQPFWKIVVSPTEEGREAGLTQWLVEIDARADDDVLSPILETVARVRAALPSGTGFIGFCGILCP